MLRSDDVEALTGLGLSVLQAKVYLALADLGKATVKAISKTAEVARQDMYRLISELQEMGIFEKLIGAPNEYRALPMQEGINILIERRQKESSEACANAMNLLQRHRKECGSTKLTVESQFVLVPQNEPFILKLKKLIENTQTGVETACSWRRLARGTDVMADVISDALKRGVEFRIIVEENPDMKAMPKTVKAFMANPLFKVRISASPRIGVIGIYDQKEMLLSTSVEGSIADSPGLWTNNESLMALVEEHFEGAWTKASEIRRSQKKCKDFAHLSRRLN